MAISGWLFAWICTPKFVVKQMELCSFFQGRLFRGLRHHGLQASCFGKAARFRNSGSDFETADFIPGIGFCVMCMFRVSHACLLLSVRAHAFLRCARASLGCRSFFYGVVSLGQTVWGKENVVCVRISEGGVRLSKHWNVLRAPPHPLFQCWSVDGSLDARSVSDEATPAR